MGHKGQDPEPNGLTFLGLDPFGHEKSQVHHVAKPGTADESHREGTRHIGQRRHHGESGKK